MRRLDLDEAQREQVRAIAERHEEGLRQGQQQLREARGALDAAVRTVPMDEARVHTLALALGDAQARASVQEGRLFSEIWPVLTPEQQQRVQQPARRVLRR